MQLNLPILYSDTVQNEAQAPSEPGDGETIPSD